MTLDSVTVTQQRHRQYTAISVKSRHDHVSLSSPVKQVRAQRCICKHPNLQRGYVLTTRNRAILYFRTYKRGSYPAYLCSLVLYGVEGVAEVVAVVEKAATLQASTLAQGGCLRQCR